jgi:hypothetical protein
MMDKNKIKRLVKKAELAIKRSDKAESEFSQIIYLHDAILLYQEIVRVCIEQDGKT